MPPQNNKPQTKKGKQGKSMDIISLSTCMLLIKGIPDCSGHYA